MNFFLHKSPPNRWFRNEIYSLLRRADARGHADIINSTVCDAYHHFAGKALLMTSQRRSRAEYLIPMDYVIVDAFLMIYNLTNKCNLISRP